MQELLINFSCRVNLEEVRSEPEGNLDVIFNKMKNILRAENFWDFSTETCIYIYTGITVATIIVTLTRSISFFTLCMKSSVKLHDRMFNSIIRGSMRFFNTNSSGRILNRFSKDMGSIDELLPAAMIDCFQIFLALLGVVVVVAIVNPWLMIPTAAIAVIFYLLRVFYLITSRSIKRLEGVSKYCIVIKIYVKANTELLCFSKKSSFFSFKCFFARFNNNSSFWSTSYIGKGV